MNSARFRMTLAVLGVLLAAPTMAATLTVYSKMGGAAFAPTDAAFPLGTVVPVTTGDTTISCATNSPANCVDSAVALTTVQLQANVSPNATFVSWAGCTSVAGNVCTVTYATGVTAKTVTANFKPTAYWLATKTYPVPTATFTPPYGGTLTAAAVPAIDCKTGDAAHAACLGLAANGASVQVTAVPAAGSKVSSWSGCASVAADVCTVSMTNSKAVSATFASAYVPVTVQVVGSGTVTSSAIADTVSCPGDCTGGVASGGSVTLTATPALGSKFLGWTGACTGTGACTLTAVTAAKSVAATFKAAGCTGCHPTPPATPTHTAVLDAIQTGGCAGCHGGTALTTSSNDPLLNSTIHINGTVNVTAAPVAKPAGVGLAIDVAGVSWTDDAKPQVTYWVKDPVAGTNLTLGTAAGISSVTFTLSKLQDDGTYLSPITSTATGANFVDGDGVTRTPALATAGRAGSVSTSTSGSVNTKNADGSYTYTFPNALDWGTDGARLHTLAAWGTRTLSGYNFRANDHVDFAPDGTSVTPREVVSDAACNACHGQLTLHGSRTGVKSCLTCHSPQSVDPESGNDVDMATMIHKIHNGALLANTYFIVGYQQHYYGYNHILMAPSHSGYFESGGTLAGSHDPGLSRECGICHQGAQAGNAFSKSSQRACGACHDTVNANTGVNHAAGPQTDATCNGCHQVGSGPLNLESNATAHSRFFDNLNNVDFLTDVTPAVPAGGHVFTANLVSVTQSGSNFTWTVDFALDGSAFSINPLPNASYRLSTCAFTLAGPTTDYTLGVATSGQPVGGTAQSCTTVGTWTAVGGTPGRYTYTAAPTYFTGKPDGYYTASFEIMISRVYGDGTNFVRKPFSANPNFLTLKKTGTAVAQVTEALELAANARRAVVEFDKCNACHVDLGFHSNRGRKGPDYCAMCHNPRLDNGSRARAKAADAYTMPFSGTTKVYLPESVSMNVFIHRIHMGDVLPSVAGNEIGRSTVSATGSVYVPEPGKIVYGATRSNFTGLDTNSDSIEDSPPELADFTEFAMPNPMNRCEQCHIEAGATRTWALPERPGLAPVERTYRVCNPYTPTWSTESWCNAPTSNASGMPRTGGAVTAAVTVVTPPLKASCTSCHDSAATDAHADLYTLNPMTAGATELCASCHGAGTTWDSIAVHRPVPY